MSTDLFAGALTPLEAFAFRRLDTLRGEDLPRLAMIWLEQGSVSASVAELAGERYATIAEHGALLDLALREMGMWGSLGEKSAAWIFIRRLLRAIVDGEIAARSGVGAIISRAHYRDIVLFAPRNLAGEGRPFAGEELGIEFLLGDYYDLENAELLRHPDAMNTRTLRSEAGRVLAQFYTEPPLFDESRA